jgi:hypothetical protein
MDKFAADGKCEPRQGTRYHCGAAACNGLKNLGKASYEESDTMTNGTAACKELVSLTGLV